MHYVRALCGALLLSLVVAVAAEGASITCSGANRSFSLGDATLCTSGIDANPDGALINAQASAWTGAWMNEGELTSGGLNDLFTVTVLNGSFGGGNVSGTWAISPAFWSTWGKGVVSVHVGQGSGDPDWWMFLLEPGDLTGTWAYVINSGEGGGLSNLKLWGSGAPSQRLLQTPEPATLLMLGTGLVGFSFTLRRRRRFNT